MSNEYAFKCAFVDGSTCCSYVLKRDASHLLVIRYVPHLCSDCSNIPRDWLFATSIETLQRDSVTFIARVLNASCDVSCDYSFSSFFFLSSIFSTLSLHLSYIFSRLLLSRSLFLSTVSRQHKTRRDVSRTIDSNLNWLFNIPACSNWCTYSHWCLSRDHCIREPKRNTDHCVCVLTIQPNVHVRCLPLITRGTRIRVGARANLGTQTQRLHNELLFGILVGV